MRTTRALVIRNLRIYARDRMGVFLSLLSALILLLLYVLFLGTLQVDNLTEKFPDVDTDTVSAYVSSWVFAGIIMITTFTTGFAALGTYVDDRVTGRFKEFRVSPVRRSQLIVGYQVSATIVSLAMSYIVMAIGILLLKLMYGVWPGAVNVLVAAGYTALLSAAFSALSSWAITFVATNGTFTAMSTIMGTLLGFLAGAYLPLGVVSENVRNVINVLPFSPAAMLLREPLAGTALDKLSPYDEATKAVRTYYGHTLTVGSTEILPWMVVVVLAIITIVFTVLGSYRIGRTIR
ncbi:ABC transporter permease [Schaalia canis]|uniref:ABC transporter permease n=1 Tax=Schaalia canis TaxID=100469 RepID=A0A3P1SC36_9ACTO|nr:ABC transporter permease [Schaalia canis]RRC94708.1 ABC transporter permease [Schaalia canis]